MILLKLIIVGQHSRLLSSYSGLTISTEQYSVNSSVCKLTSSGPTLILSTQIPSVNSQDLYPNDFHHSRIRNQLMTGDWGATHKLKPRSFNKLFSAPPLLTTRWSPPCTIAKYYFSLTQYLTPFRIVVSVYYSTLLSSQIPSLTEFTDSHWFLSCPSS